MSGRNRTVCPHWLRGRCRFGDRCKWSHDRTAPPAGADDITNRRQEREPAQERFLAWRRARPRPTASGKRNWVSSALALLDENVDITQQTVREMAREESLAIIRAIVQSLESSDLKSGRKYLITGVMPIFRILSHPQIVDSVVLEQEIGIICRCLLGIDASRLLDLFTFIFDVAQFVDLANECPSNNAILESLSVSAGVLAKVVDSSISTQLNPSFCSIVERFSITLAKVVNGHVNFHCIQALKHLEYVQRRLGIGKALPGKSTAPSAAAAHARFTLSHDMPGALSRHGKRHGNDHEDISDISLMPTGDEIMSQRDEYLPTTDTALHHLDGVRGLLDRHFRLLREDLFYDLRNSVRSELEQLAGQTPSRSSGELRTKVRTYHLTRAKGMTFEPRQGLELEIQILQPHFARRLQKTQRVEAWTQSQRLAPGSLVCAVDEVGTVAFFLVSPSTQISVPERRADDPKNINEDIDNRPKTSLADDENFSHLWLQPIESNGEDSVKSITWFKSLGAPFNRRLLEFPGILIPSALPPLKALQEMSIDTNLPFQDILLNPQNSGRSLTPPLYTLRPGFSFDLSCICSNEASLRYQTSETPDAQSLSNSSSLDPTQASAILNSLRRSIAITQGPPGTGKSYTGEALIKVLLDNKSDAKLGPILCVCYTNHALDQLLEHLLDGGVEQIVRIGSRSKSERLAEVNLRKVASTITRTRIEGKRLFENREALDSIAQLITRRLNAVKFQRTDDLVKAHLAENHPQWHRELFGGPDENEEGFQTVAKKKKGGAKQWLTSGDDSQETGRDLEELQLLWAFNLPRKDRLVLYDHWVYTATRARLDSLGDLFEEYVRLKRHNDSLRADLDLRCLQSANIIGITTTGLARNLPLLRRVRSKVLLCEEAGEVLEGHLLNAFLPSIEHAILIGDHLQLRPQIQDWRLQRANPAGLKYSLDTSLFERLVQGEYGQDGIPLSVLDTQRRMHPDIAELVRSTLYPNLLDADNVREYPQVPGMARRLFWLDHSKPENGHDKHDAADTSRSNDFEVELVSEMVSHLIRQGAYKPGDIAVLTPYLGQLHKLRRKLSSTIQIVLNDRDTKDLAESELVTASQVGKSSSLAEVRAATVDNFQGEEARVVIVSLVRSNEQNRPGFLNTSNRINVLLSRAKHGMYIVGNASTFSTVPMWAATKRLLGDNFGPQIQLQCPRHASTEIYVEKPEDFLTLAPDGGCTLPCEKRLTCGHACPGPCHSDTLHSVIKCLEPCQRFKQGCDHKCPLSCGELCETRCNVTVEDLELTLGCGHMVTSASCWQTQNTLKLRCVVPVLKTLTGCTHEHTVPCFIDVDSNYNCTTPCGTVLPCGHSCKRQCYKCRQGDNEETEFLNHGGCTQPCGRGFTTCSHSCEKPCHGEVPCSPCQKPCENRCQHSKCDRQCSKPCVPCAETNCSSRCPHSACSMPCAAPCDWLPCSLRCEKTLGCGHRCPSICGEECPLIEFCQICASDDIKTMTVDYIMYSEYEEVDLDKEPCIFPDCGHPLTFTSMDGQMGIPDHYFLSPEGMPTAIKAPLQPFSSPEDTPIKVCPTCRGSLRNISRYGRIVRRGLLDETTKKFIAWSSGQLNQKIGRFAAVEDALDTAESASGEVPKFTAVDYSLPRKKCLSAMCDAMSNGSRHSPLKQVRGQLESLLRQLDRDEQPYQRVANLMRFVGNQKYEAEVQMSGYIKTLGVLLRCDLFILGKYLKRAPDRVAAAANLRFDDLTRDCESVIALSKEKKLARSQVEGYILLARLYALIHSFFETTTTDAQSPRERGEDQLRLAEQVMEESASAKALQPELEMAWRQIRGSFYSTVSKEERLAVYQAMAQEFKGTGHWYTCVQGHPFTVGECGMPMQQARCPECDSPVGGQDHRPVQGVQHDDEMERLARGVNTMDI